MTKDPFLGKAIINGEPVYTSVSALKLAESCLRRWKYRYAHGLKDEETKSLKEGIQFHGEVEHYLKNNDRSQLSGRVLSGLNNLPTPGPDLFVELPLLPTTSDNRVDFGAAKLRAAGIPVYGKIDLVHERPENHGVLDILDAKDEPGVVKIEDHKFVKNLDYALDKPGLVSDLQTAGYGLWTFLQAPSLERVRLSHNYFPARGGAYKSTVLTNRESLEKTWKRADAIGVSIIDAAREPDVDKIDFNLRACRAYGHDCPAKSVCRAANHNSLASLIGVTAAENALVQIRPKPFEPENNDMTAPSILDRLRNQPAGQAPTATTAPVAPPILAIAPSAPPPLVAQAPATPVQSAPTLTAPSPASGPSQADIQAEMARLKAAEAAAAAPTPAAAPAPVAPPALPGAVLAPAPILSAEDAALLQAMDAIRSVGIGFPTLSGFAAGHVGRITGRTPTPRGVDHFIDGEGPLATYTIPEVKHLMDPQFLPAIVEMARQMQPSLDGADHRDAKQMGVQVAAPPPATSAPTAVASAPVEAPAPVANSPAAATEAPPTAPKKRGRPPKAKVETPAEATMPAGQARVPVLDNPGERITVPVVEAPQTTTPSAPAQILQDAASSMDLPPPAPATAPVAASTASSAINVYVDCTIEGLKVESLWPRVHEICTIMNEKASGDFRSADVKPWNYSGWKAILRAFLAEAQIPPGNYSFDGQGGDIGTVVVEALREMAHKSGGVFVRGAR